MDPRERAAEILAAWREERRTGGGGSADDLLRRHPDLEREIRQGLAAHDLLDEAFAHLDDPSREGAEADPAPEPAPRVLGDYRILREIGRGGMGVVYEAEQTSLKRRVAVKVLYPSITRQARAVERFRREARSAARLHHTHIVPVHGLGCEGGHWFYAMELVDGRPLHRVIADLRHLEGGRAPERPSSPSATPFDTASGRREEFAQVARAFWGVADAVAAAHAAGVVHRDLKPANLLLDAQGNLKVLDFGLALALDEDTGLTATGDVVGTPAYMSPEQARGEDADGRSDIYSLGATLYEVLTHRPPFDGRTPAEILQRVLARDPPPPRRIQPRIPRDLETIVLKAMAREREGRYATAAELAHDLLMFAEGGAIRARRRPLPVRAWRAVRRRPLRTAAVLSLAVAAVGLVVLGQARAREAERREDLEYARLLEDARGILFDNSTSAGGWSHASAEVRAAFRESVERALTVRPGSFEAWVLRTHVAEGLDERLRCLDEARTRGLPERAYRMLRWNAFQGASREEEAAAELTLAEALPDTGEAATLEASALLAAGRHQDAIRRATVALSASLDPTGRASALLTRAFAREAEGDLPAALEDLAAARNLRRRGDVGLDIRAAALWKRLDRPARADAEVERALDGAKAAGTAEAWVALGEAALAAREHAWADRALAEVPPHLAGDPRLLEVQGDLAWARYDLPRALERFEAALAAGGDEASLHRSRGAALLALGKPEEALQAARAAWARAPGDANAATLETMAQRALGRQEEALATLQKRAERLPNDHGIWHNLATELRQAGRHGEALQAIERALSAHPLCQAAQAQRVWILCDLDRGGEGLQAAERAIGLLGPSARLLAARSDALRRLARTREALAAAEQAVALDPQEAMARKALAFSLLHLGRFAEAVTAFDAALGSDPRDELLHQARAQALLGSGRFADALEATTAGIARRPDLGWWRLQHGSILQMAGRPVEALAALEEAARADPSLAPQTLVGRIECLRALGRHADVLPLLDLLPPGTMAEADREERRIHALTALGRRDDAAAAVRAIAARAPEDLHVAYTAVCRMRALGLEEEARAVAGRATTPPAPEGGGPLMTYGGARGLYAYLAAMAGKGDAARAVLAGLPEPRNYGDAYQRGCIHALLGERDQALRWLQAAVDRGLPPFPAGTPRDPDFALLDEDPRFASLRARVWP